VQWLTAYGPDEKRMRIREVDAVNGVMGACACMTALVHRQRTGEGQWIDLSQLEATIHSLVGSQLLEVSTNQASRAPAGNRHPHFAPQGCYRCGGDDAWVTITIRSDGEWQRLCDRVGLGDWKVDPRFATTAGRMERHDEIDAAIERWTASHPALEVMRVLQSEGIAAGAVHSVADLAKDPHLAARGFFQGAADGTPGRFPGSPVRLSGVQPAVRRRGPRLGEHGHDVICGTLGRPEDDVTPVKVADIRTGYDIE
jgi:crotonobetainyl-CoA:carnitine CoA-transferase CaiB-like acyl-CoA transferase